MTRVEARELAPESKQNPFRVESKRLTLPQAMEVYALATPTERDAAYPALVRKFKDTIRNVPEDQRRALVSQLQSFMMERVNRKNTSRPPEAPAPTATPTPPGPPA